MAEGVRGGRSISLTMKCTVGAVRGGAFFPQPALFAHQEPLRDERAGRVVVPALPGAHLVVVEADRALAQVERLLDEVALGRDLHERRARRAERGVRHEVPAPAAVEGLDDQESLLLRALAAARLDPPDRRPA